MKSPKDFSFKSVNEFVHDPNVHFEELQSLCLALANELDPAFDGETGDHLEIAFDPNHV